MQLPVLCLALYVLVGAGIPAVLGDCSKCRNSFILPDSLLKCAEKCGAGSFAAKVKSAGLEKEFTDKGKKSLFAPTDKAFKAVPKWVTDRWDKDPELLKSTLRYHLTSARYHSSDLSNNKLLSTHYTGAAERVNIYAASGSSITTVNGYTFGGPSIDLKKEGNVFPLNGCFYRLPTLTIFDYIATNNSFTTLRLAVARANLENQLEGADLTMFAPTNAAFSRLPAGVLADLLNHPDKLADMVRGHVVKGVYYSPGMPNNAVLATLAGRNVTVTVAAGHMKVNNATVVEADIPAGNGALHAIDAVLLP